VLKTDSAVSRGGQGKLTYFTYFPWNSNVDLKFLPLIYTCQEASVTYLHVAYDPLKSKRNYPALNISQQNF